MFPFLSWSPTDWCEFWSKSGNTFQPVSSQEAKTKVRSCACIVQEKKMRKKNLHTYWQLPQLCDRQQSTFFETEFRSPNFCSWPAKQSCAYKIYVKWFINCCSGSKRVDCVLFWHWAPSIPTDYCRRLPHIQGETQVHTRLLHAQEISRQRTLGSHGALYKVLAWCPEELEHRTWLEAHQQANTVTVSVTVIRLCYVQLA